tara:strand:+ start:211 stop:639 length:429 start_codon:yes stop_codon:yes gene_type:complete
MASYDAGVLTNKSKRSSRVYSDLNLDFLQNTATKDIQKIEDVDAVKRSVRNLINTNYYERPFRPSLGSNLRAMLFELYSPQMSHAISKEIDLLIKNYEPRARLVNVKTNSDPERNGYEVSISFYVVNFPEQVQVQAFLERLR